MKKYAFVFAVVIGSLLLWNQDSAGAAYTSAACQQQHGSPVKGRVPAYYKSLEDVKEIPKTLSPDKFTDAETKAAYLVAQENPKLLLQLPCYCFCDDGLNHKSLLSCYIDEHAVHCDICRKEAIDGNRLQKEQNLTPEQIREKLALTNGHLGKFLESPGHNSHAAATANHTAGNHSATALAAPAFALKNLRGKTVRLEDYKGKVVLINFWATWCAPCQSEMPELVKLQKKYAAKGLQILGVTYEPEKLTAVNRVARKFKINYPLLFGSEELSKQYKIEEVLPVTILVDREGKMQSQILGMIDTKDVEEKIAPLLK
jgi:cytochrome c biogenesis protein CcmG, thiol:disulfide interchange protein DsbE